MNDDQMSFPVAALTLIGAGAVIYWLWSLSWWALMGIGAAAAFFAYLRSQGREIVAQKEADKKARIMEAVERREYDWQQD